MAVAALAMLLLAVACSGGGSTSTASSPTSPSTTAPEVTVPASTTTTKSPIDGVQTFSVVAAHSDAPVNYPNVPPVGGTHNPTWQPCTFYDAPVQSEKAVHSLEHGAIWVTYRPDLPAAEVDTLAALARSRKDIVASRWDSGLPAPVVVTAWGRQLALQSVSDPRLMAFVLLYTNKGPELNAPC